MTPNIPSPSKRGRGGVLESPSICSQWFLFSHALVWVPPDRDVFFFLSFFLFFQRRQLVQENTSSPKTFAPFWILLFYLCLPFHPHRSALPSFEQPPPQKQGFRFWAGLPVEKRWGWNSVRSGPLEAVLFAMWRSVTREVRNKTTNINNLSLLQTHWRRCEVAPTIKFCRQLRQLKLKMKVFYSILLRHCKFIIHVIT